MSENPVSGPLYRERSRRNARYKLVRFLFPQAATLLAQDHPDAPWSVGEEWTEWGYDLRRALEAAFPEEMAAKRLEIRHEVEAELDAKALAEAMEAHGEGRRPEEVFDELPF